MKAPRLLLVDDDAELVDVLSMALEDEGFEVHTAADGRQGWAAFQSLRPDLVVLDLLMPELDGMELTKRIRAAHAAPIIMLTSRGEEMDKVLGFDAGADDYVTKPFSTRELLARVRAVLRRAGGGPEARIEQLEVRRLQMDRDRREVLLDGESVELTATEFELLWTLVARRGHVFSRNELLDEVYGIDVFVTMRTIDTFVKRLRQKLSRPGHAFDEIDTVRGIGYRYKA